MTISKPLKSSLQLLKRLFCTAQGSLVARVTLRTQNSSTVRRFASKAHCNVGTIGHIDHGKTSLTSAITKFLGDQGLSKYVSYDQIDRAPEEKARGITINACHVEYETATRHYAHTDCPGHIDFIKNMIVGTSQMDGAVLVVAASEGCMPQTREHLLLAKQIGVGSLVVYVNKRDLVDEETSQLVELEVQELLEELGWDACKVPFIHGSSLCALQGSRPDIGTTSIQRLLDCMDEHIRLPLRDQTTPFLMPIATTFSIPGRGTVVVGTVQQGVVAKGDQLFLKGFGNNVKTAASDLQIFNRSTPRAVAGENVGVLLRGVKREFVERGMFLAGGREGGCEQVEVMEAQWYVQTPQEGGRSRPITSGYAGTMFLDTWNIQCMLHFRHLQEDNQTDKQTNPQITNKNKKSLKNNKSDNKNTNNNENYVDSTQVEMAMPGDVCRGVVYLRRPMVVREGQRFFVKEANITTVTGVVTKVFPAKRVDIKGFNYIPPSSHKIEGNASKVVRRRMKMKEKK